MVLIWKKVKVMLSFWLMSILAQVSSVYTNVPGIVSFKSFNIFTKKKRNNRITNIIQWSIATKQIPTIFSSKQRKLLRFLVNGHCFVTNLNLVTEGQLVVWVQADESKRNDLDVLSVKLQTICPSLQPLESTEPG